MPYIKQEQREYFEVWLDTLRHCFISDAGELNFLLTLVLTQYLISHENNYSTRNDIVGALECCKQEFIRRRVNDYEDEKIKSNGDVYGG